MNLASTILIYAGGPGSGPNAPCPQCGPTGKHVEEGDLARVKNAVKMYTKFGDNYKVSPGAQATVVKVLPKVGTQEQMATVRIKEEGEAEVVGTLPLHSLETTHSREDIPEYAKSYTRNMNLPKNPLYNIAPVRKSQVIMHTETNDGASLTWVKPKEESDTSPKTLKEISNTPHNLKGDFERINTLNTGELGNVGKNRVTRVYDTSPLPTQYQQRKGSVVYVSSLTKDNKINTVVVREQNYEKHGEAISSLEFRYKNAAAAVGMLKSRYGISISLKRLRGGK